MGEAAAVYARHGWAVFPITPRSKIPMTEHGCLDASSDAETVREWWTRTPEANIGLATGRASGILAVDLDGREGFKAWCELMDREGAPITLAQETGSGGHHLLYRIPRGARVRNTAKRLGPGIDTRGDGGYILVHPSIHPCGRPYRWEGTAKIATAPPWLLRRLAPPARPALAPPKPELTSGDGTPYGLAALERMLGELARAEEGTRNDTLNVCAYSLGRLVSGGELRGRVVSDALEAAGVAIGLTRHEVIRTIQSGMQSGFRRPRSAA